MDWNEMTQYRGKVTGICDVGKELSGSVICGNFLNS